LVITVAERAQRIEGDDAALLAPELWAWCQEAVQWELGDGEQQEAVANGGGCHENFLAASVIALEELPAEVAVENRQG
jgi:hypothetical protein